MPRSLSRSLNRRTTRLLSYHCTRMLGGARRPDWLAIYCRTIRRILQIDKSLRPFLQEQTRLYEKQLLEQKVQAALHRVYGPAPPEPPSRSPSPGGEGRGEDDLGQKNR